MQEMQIHECIRGAFGLQNFYNKVPLRRQLFLIELQLATNEKLFQFRMFKCSKSKCLDSKECKKEEGKSLLLNLGA